VIYQHTKYTVTVRVRTGSAVWLFCFSPFNVSAFALLRAKRKSLKPQNNAEQRASKKNFIVKRCHKDRYLLGPKPKISWAAPILKFPHFIAKKLS